MKPLAEAIVNINPDDDAYIWNRNGSPNITLLSVYERSRSDRPTACVYAEGARGAIAKCGFTIPSEVMDELAWKWLRSRGLLSRTGEKI